MGHPGEVNAERAELAELVLDLYELVMRLGGEYERAAAQAGLTLPQAAVLTLLSAPMAMRGLAEGMGCDPSNITGIVDRLEEKGLVNRSMDPSDRRVKQVAPTPAARDAVARFRDELVRHSFLAQLPPEVRRRLRNALAEIHTHPR